MSDFVRRIADIPNDAGSPDGELAVSEYRDKVLRTLRAIEQEAALDVERLARATAAVVGWTGVIDYHREWAEKVAREYEKLRTPEGEG